MRFEPKHYSKIDRRYNPVLKQEVCMVKWLTLARPRFSEKIENSVSMVPEFPQGRAQCG
jgi:hypothetical protein